MQKYPLDAKAIGVILLENVQNELKIYPIVWVKDVNTMYYETACGSGSLAAAIYKNTAEEIEIIQPSGYSIKVKILNNGNYIENAVISGIVKPNID